LYNSSSKSILEFLGVLETIYFIFRMTVVKRATVVKLGSKEVFFAKFQLIISGMWQLFFCFIVTEWRGIQSEASDGIIIASLLPFSITYVSRKTYFTAAGVQ